MAMPEPTFLLDHMVVKLGKYLRILGYDAEWDLSARTQELVRRANVEGRIFVTRNRHPERYPNVTRSIMLESDDPVVQLRRVVEQAGLDVQAGLFSRCIRCNVTLEQVADKESVEGRVHPNVYARYETFYACPSCHTVFWHGTHVGNTCRKLGIEGP
jgi:uncharacterized protein with PIN domain